jgi:hypothetical protein
VAFLACSSVRQQASAPIKEASTNLDLKHLEPLLVRIIPLIESGFSTQEVRQVVAATKAMKVEDAKKFSFSIRFQGSSSSLDIQVEMDDVDAINVYFFGVPELAEKISKEIKRFSDEQGL